MTEADKSPSHAAWQLLGGFLAGFVGIQVLSRLLHHCIPSEVVDCDPTHRKTSLDLRNHNRAPSKTGSNLISEQNYSDENRTSLESCPLIPKPTGHQNSSNDDTKRYLQNSFIKLQKRLMSFINNAKSDCNSDGPCFGYSDPCAHECPTSLNQRLPNHASGNGKSNKGNVCSSHISGSRKGFASKPLEPCSFTQANESSLEQNLEQTAQVLPKMDVEAQHHHHVPENTFMSIGFQTSIAIAIHKIPEGFITYATNHANPSLGFSVFLAIFVHNISEGFALSLPIFLALKSRWKAMVFASILGGFSQPLGAAIASTWFRFTNNKGEEPHIAVYGYMFAITSGIMSSVAMQLFAEGLSISHNQNLCIAFGFTGMCIMCMSNALTS